MDEKITASIQMPRYRCHKEVYALKIAAIEDPHQSNNYQWRLQFENEKYAPSVMSVEYMEKHKPQVGGYLVVYDDGYESWSPAKAFEEGYTLIE